MESPQLKNCIFVGGASSTAGGNVRRHFDAVAVDSTISGICRFLRSLRIHFGEYVTFVFPTGDTFSFIIRYQTRRHFPSRLLR